ncbi:hypothetical protein KHA94_11535 [Bacillus sp. FJAT-49705]|uniref:TetR family transcriptional regulator n=1 Tax=Cytobacillus citreus TaxID=2833586 RepID=A0ABS5NSK9_9BACI|nr:hypothetical protein [Cytobacillus citreus]MBS4190815.1 hypothetical protein [Cytobacillus citreus]
MLQEGKDSGEFLTTFNNDLIARLFWSIINGISFQYATMDQDNPYEQVVEEGKKMFINYLIKNTSVA